MIETLTNAHYETILDLFEGTNSDIKIISPFLSTSMAEKLCSCIKNKPNITCMFITRFYLEDFLNKSNNLEALQKMLDCGVEIYAVKGLHTKLYLFDSTEGILGSANFTVGGFKSNIELSLLIQNENELLKDLHSYFNDLIKKIELFLEGKISKELISKMEEKYLKAFKSREKDKDNNSINGIMYGAEIDNQHKFNSMGKIADEIEKSKSDKDIVYNMFKGLEQRDIIELDHTIWMKFAGEGNDRIYGKYQMTKVEINGKDTFLSCYPWKPSSVKDNDEIYLAALTYAKGKAQPGLIGRGRMEAFNNANHVQETWINDFEWMSRYPWYCVIKAIRILNTDVKNGLPLNNVLAKLGSDTYVSSFGKNESPYDVAKKHYQKAHIRLSGNAKEYIDEKLDE